MFAGNGTVPIDNNVSEHKEPPRHSLSQKTRRRVLGVSSDCVDARYRGESRRMLS